MARPRRTIVISTFRSAVLAATAALVVPHAIVSAQAPARPFPQHVAHAPGTIKPSHRTQSQLDADVALAYDQWKANYLKFAGNSAQGLPMYRVSFGSTNPGRTVSEGQGFGMIAVAFMAGHDPLARTFFDGLWRFARANPSAIDTRLMTWQVPRVQGLDASAFDGDCDMAFALLLAHAQWGSAGGSGTFAYLSEFETLATGIMQSTIGPQSRLPMLGDWVNPNGGTHNQWTPRTSDFMVGHYAAFARATGSVAWSQVRDSVQSAIASMQANHAPGTGLLPDFCVPTAPGNTTLKPAPAGFLEGPNDGNYYYNAFRDPWRIGVHALVEGDAGSLAAMRKLTDWVFATTGGATTNLRAGYTLAGAPVPGSNYFTTVVAAPLAIAAMTRPAQQTWLNALYDKVFAAHEDYYEDSVALLSLLVITGNWWDPTLAVGECNGDLDANGTVDGADLAALLGSWGAVPPSSPADLDGNGIVNGADLAALLGAWGPCPS